MSDDPFDVRRRIERRTVTLNSFAKGSKGLAKPVTLLDLSPLGFRARGATGLAPGDHFRFELPAPFDTVAKVLWTDGEEFGGEFRRLLCDVGLRPEDTSGVSGTSGRVRSGASPGW